MKYINNAFYDQDFYWLFFGSNYPFLKDVKLKYGNVIGSEPPEHEKTESELERPLNWQLI